MYITVGYGVEFNAGIDDYLPEAKNGRAKLTEATVRLYDSLPNAKEPETSIVKAANGRIAKAS